MIARKKEQKNLNEAYCDENSQFVAIYGRRRIGKTYLVREAFEGRFSFRHTGLARADKNQQIAEFKKSLKKFGMKDLSPIKDWYTAFDRLEELLEAQPVGRKVVFLDEVPWMDTGRCEFVSALEHFWNGWADYRKDVLLIICGSSTSWIIDKVINDKGGLHNRVTRNIYLEPFTLGECEEYVLAQGWKMSKMEIAETYMAIGGVPYYWTLLEKGNSVAQNFDMLFFAPQAKLKDEFALLYRSLFRRPEGHLRIVEALGRKKVGMTIAEFVKISGIAYNGHLVKMLTELEQCGFIRRYNGFGGKRSPDVFQLVDNFTLFYFKFLDGEANPDENFWKNHVLSPVVYNWRGLAFERLCLQHITQIKQKLGISGVSTKVYAWSGKNSGGKGTQIDLLIDRADNVVNVCEMKFTNGLYEITEAEDLRLSTRLETFANVAGGNRSVHLTMVTSRGLVENSYSRNVQSQITLNDLFS